MYSRMMCRWFLVMLESKYLPAPPPPPQRQAPSAPPGRHRTMRGWSSFERRSISSLRDPMVCSAVLPFVGTISMLFTATKEPSLVL